MKDCIHQIRLWNPTTPIYLILEPFHKEVPFWRSLTDYSIELVYTNTLEPTPHHTYFRTNFQGDIHFRKGYWKHVKERFFYIEELMHRESLVDVLSMEYDVLLYTPLMPLLKKFKSSHQTLRIVRDNDTRGHPALIYIPTYGSIKGFNIFITFIIQTPLEDMQALAAYASSDPTLVHYLPVITEKKNRSILQRKSTCNHMSQDPWYLSEDSEHFEILFDSLVVGQWVGGIDSRNTGGQKIANYENESALYNINEMKFQWKKNPETLLWQPFLDGRLLATIHVHSKSLISFRSDRSDYPKDDYDVTSVYKTLYPN
jgi:hypothetical protein